jgi:transposase
MRESDKSKQQQLRKHNALNLRADAVTHPTFSHSEFFDRHDLVLVKYEMLRAVRVDNLTASEAAKQFGFSRSGYYKVLGSFQRTGLAGLIPSSPGPREAHKLCDDILDLIDGQLAEDDTLNSMQLAVLLREHHKLSVHPRSIERALARREKRGPETKR